ncbi:MAG TPA: hypothetical protein VM737_06205 [Gemmatimonadota bacterium]|nr:hypothetical protein [Gemmatimonadota bacterium]
MIAGFALWGVVVVFVLLPRIPDTYVGNLWLWVAGYAAVVLIVRDVWRRAPAICRSWSGLPRVRRSLAGAAAVVFTLAGTLALRHLAPGPFGKLSRENGLWEPMCLALYWGGAVLLWRTTRNLDPAARRAWLAVVGFFVLLGLEEIDHFGIFGGIFGHVDGVYAGSLHDVIRLVSEGVLGPVGMAVLAGVLLAVLAVLWRLRVIVPSFLVRLVARAETGWLLAGLAILLVAAAEEAHLFGWVAAPPTPEEAIELGGALCLGLYALELAVGGALPVEPRRRPTTRLFAVW